jgi:hypothetical protein
LHRCIQSVGEAIFKQPREFRAANGLLNLLDFRFYRFAGEPALQSAPLAFIFGSSNHNLNLELGRTPVHITARAQSKNGKSS